VPRDEHTLERGEIAVDLDAQIGEALLQRRDLVADGQLLFLSHLLQLVDLILQLDDGLFELERGRSGHLSSRVRVGRARRQATRVVRSGRRS
jgi:hypothetical protein